MIIIVNSNGNKFSGPKDESPKMHKALKEKISEYKRIYNDDFFIRRCQITRDGIIIILNTIKLENSTTENQFKGDLNSDTI